MAGGVRRIIEAFAAPLFGLVGYGGDRWVARHGSGWIALAHGDGSERIVVGVLLSQPGHLRPTMTIDLYDTLGTELLLARHEDEIGPLSPP